LGQGRSDCRIDASVIPTRRRRHDRLRDRNGILRHLKLRAARRAGNDLPGRPIIVFDLNAAVRTEYVHELLIHEG
jgi:hypothetical protein